MPDIREIPYGRTNFTVRVVDKSDPKPVLALTDQRAVLGCRAAAPVTKLELENLDAIR